ncbi:hypothetical protein K170097C1_07620 [Hungatella effluvii]
MAPPVACGPAYFCVTASSYQIHIVKSKDMHQEEKNSGILQKNSVVSFFVVYYILNISYEGGIYR